MQVDIIWNFLLWDIVQGEIQWLLCHGGIAFLSIPSSIMHAVLLGPVICILSLCSARLAQDDTFQTTPLNSTASQLGIPHKNPRNVDAYVASIHGTPLRF